MFLINVLTPIAFSTKNQAVALSKRASLESSERIKKSGAFNANTAERLSRPERLNWTTITKKWILILSY